MLWSTVSTQTAHFGRFAATAAVLLLMSAGPTPALATKGVKLITKYPTNERECGEILDKVLDAMLTETGGDGLAVHNFLMGTQADKVLPELCAHQNYGERSISPTRSSMAIRSLLRSRITTWAGIAS
jgi:hypothetical protein